MVFAPRLRGSYGTMTGILPQQRLLLELLAMSGAIAVPDSPNDTILWRTVQECLERHWIQRGKVGGGFCSVEMTALGRSVLGDQTPA